MSAMWPNLLHKLRSDRYDLRLWIKKLPNCAIAIQAVSNIMTQQYQPETASNIAYTLWAYALALRDIAFGNVVYAETVTP